MKPIMYVTCILILLLLISTIQAKNDKDGFSYFADSETDQLNNIAVAYASRSLETKVYTLDMLFKNPETRSLYDNLSINYSVKGKVQELDYELKNKFNLIVDIGKTKNVDFEITNDRAYIQYFRSVKKEDILNYLRRLNKNNNSKIPGFINEAAEYFSNPEFYKAYAEYLQETTGSENTNQVINCYLLGGDFLSVASLIELNSTFSDKQKVFVLSKARKYDKAISLYLSNMTKSNIGLSRLCDLVYMDNLLDRAEKGSALSVISDNDSNNLLSHYSDQREYIKGYLFTQLRYPSNTALLTTWREKARSYCITVLSEVSDDNFKLLLQTGMMVEAYNVLVAKGRYLEAIDMMEAHPGKNYADTTSVYSKAAEQLLKKDTMSYSYDRIVYLFEKGENWNRAGYYADKSGDKNRAVKDYEKSIDKQYDVISRLYAELKNYHQAATNKILSDSTAYGEIAYLYEQGKMYDSAAIYYYKAKNYLKSASCGELANPKDYVQLTQAYIEIGNENWILECLDHLYKSNPTQAKEYYKSTGHLDIYRKKLINEGKYQEALDSYDLNMEYSESTVDSLLELSQKANNRLLEKACTKRKLDLLVGKITDLFIADLNIAINLAKSIGDVSKEQLFAQQKQSSLAQYQKAKRGTYKGIQPSFYMKKGDSFQVLVPETTWEFTIKDNSQISFKMTSAAHYFTDFYGKSRYSPEDSYSGVMNYKVVQDEDEKYVISFKSKELLGDNLNTLTLNLKYASGMFSDNNPDPITGPDFVVSK